MPGRSVHRAHTQVWKDPSTGAQGGAGSFSAPGTHTGMKGPNPREYGTVSLGECLAIAG